MISGILHNPHARTSTVNVVVTNVSATSIPVPLILVIERVSHPSVTMANANGVTTPGGMQFFDLTGQVPGDELDAGESTAPRPLVFDNPMLVPFSVEAAVFHQVLPPAPPRSLRIEVPEDSRGRRLIGVGVGVDITIRAEGTEPVTVDVGQKATVNSRGAVFFGASGRAATATVTTTGGVDNVAQVLVRADPDNPSAFHGQLQLTASVGGTEMASETVTVLRVNLDHAASVLLKDVPVTRTVTTQPPTPDLTITARFFRNFGGGAPAINPNAESSLSVRVNPQGGGPIVTGPDGTASFTLQQGPGGHGWNFGKLIASGSKPQAQTEAQGEGGDAGKCDEGASKQDGTKDSVRLCSGEKALEVTDLTIAGRGFHYALRRTYRSHASHFRATATGDFAVDWTLSYIDDRLIRDGNNVVWLQDDFRGDTFAATGTPGGFAAPVENYVSLRINPAGDLELRNRDGMVRTYRSLSDPDIAGRLIRVEDRNGNFLSCLYRQPAGLSKHVLATVVDTMGRSIVYRYYLDSETNPGRRGRLREIEDFRRDNASGGRKVTFDYDDEGNLVSVTSPAVRGTPNGNDFPTGKTYHYTYTRQADIPSTITGLDRERLLHNLTSITYPNETDAAGSPRVILSYGEDPTDPARFDRVLTYTIGGTNATGVPAGGTIIYDYEILAPVAIGTNDPFLKTSVADRRGNVTDYVYSPFGTLLAKREFTRGFRSLEPESWDTSYVYNLDKEILETRLPGGNSVQSTFDDANRDRFQQGNALRRLRTPDPARGGDQLELVTEMVHEPIYQQVATITDPRGLDPSFTPAFSDACGRSQLERYTTRFLFDYQEGAPNLVLPLLAAELGATEAVVRARLDEAGIQLGLGDLNADGDTLPRIAGNVVRKVEPSASLLPGSNQSLIEGDSCQEIVTLYRYNHLGQLTSEVDAEGNVDTHRYFPETDPDGDLTPSAAPADGRALDATTGGYVAEMVGDAVSAPIRNNRTNPQPTNIRTAYRYDDVGNKTSITNGRGIRTDYFVNERNQVVRTTRAADVSGAAAADPAEPIPLIPFGYVEELFYDSNDNVIKRSVEDRGDISETGGFVDYIYEYDILDNQVQVTEEVGSSETLVTRFRYDPNENLTELIQPEGNSTRNVYDERDLLFQVTRGASGPRGGGPSTVTYNYDRNQNPIEEVDADDTDGSSGNSSLIAGQGDVTTHRYDGFDRRVATIDPVGSETLLNYDPASNVARRARSGTAGGSSPTSNSGAGNVDLEIIEYHHDELNRMFQEDRLLFVSPGVALARSVTITDGPLTPGDGKVTTRYEYDRSSRMTAEIDDDLDTFLTHYDGADRRVKTEDPEGNTVELAYDDNHNLIEQQETDVSQVPGMPVERFVTTSFYDSLDRPKRVVDNVGQTTDYRYDSRDNLACMADPLGPPGPTITRRAFPGDSMTVNTTNLFGNVTLYIYDGINRQTAEERLLTASGRGDGVTMGCTEEGIPIPVFADVAQAGGDGLISILTDWDGNSLVTTLTDDNGNQTRYEYDNLNRRTTETKGLCSSPMLADRCDPPTTRSTQYDADDNVIQLTDEHGSVRTCSFDGIHRPALCRISRGAGVEGTTVEVYEFDGLSRPTLATDNNDPLDPIDDSVATLAYDSLSRGVEERQQIGTLPAQAVTSSWTAEDLRTEVVYPNGRIVTYDYDGLDRPIAVGDGGAGISIAVYKYIGKARVIERSFPANETRMTYLDDTGTADVGYDGLRRPVLLRNVRADGSLIAGFRSTYDRLNNKLIEQKLHDPVNDEVYGYDSAYRLARFDRPNTGAVQPLHSAWILDGVGNWQRVDSETREHSSFNELTRRGGSTLSYDGNGNLTDDGENFAFTWDYRNRLISVKRRRDGQPVVLYKYDAAGRRIRRNLTSSGGSDETTDFYYDGWQVVEERNSLEVARQFVYGHYIDEPLVMDRNLDADATANGAGDQRLFYHQNSAFSVHALSDVAARMVEGHQYDAFGRQVLFRPGGNGVVDFGGDDEIVAEGASSVGNPYLFAGRRYDVETGWYYYRTRYLDPKAGRFTGRDMVGIWGDMGNLGNGYTYAGNNSINGLDPFGLFEWKNAGCNEGSKAKGVSLGPSAKNCSSLAQKAKVKLSTSVKVGIKVPLGKATLSGEVTATEGTEIEVRVPACSGVQLAFEFDCECVYDSWNSYYTIRGWRVISFTNLYVWECANTGYRWDRIDPKCGCEC